MRLSNNSREHLSMNWYETGLPTGERKQRGHFSTPYKLVDQILDACGYTTCSNILGVRLLDPACGSGNFLARAAQRLSQAAQTRGLSEKQTARLVARNLWGLDPDPIACFLAEMQVRAVLAARWHGPKVLPLHIHQVDSLALPTHPCIDLLVANPPYLAAKNTDLSRYRQTHQRGQADSYLLFLDLAQRLVRPGGWMGLVLPDPALVRSNAAAERIHLLREWTVLHIWHLADVFKAEVGAAIIIARHIPPSTLHHITWQRARWHARSPVTSVDTPQQQVAQTVLARQPGAELRYLLNHDQGHVIEHLRRILHEQRQQPPDGAQLVPLADLVSIKRGEEIGRESPFLLPLASIEDGYAVLRGGVDLRPYARPEPAVGITRGNVKKPLTRYLEPKLLVVKSTDKLQAVLDTRGHVVLQTLYLLHPRTPEQNLDSAYFLLALLNSRLLRTYVYYLHTAYKLVQPQIEQAVLAQLPIAWGDANARREIAERARELEQTCSGPPSVVECEERARPLYEDQERAIRRLYAAFLPGTLTDKGVVE